MKNLLILTSIYPGPDVPASSTAVVHYFAKEWHRLGFNVQVIVSPTSFPDIYYKAPDFIMKIIKKRVGWELHKKRYDYKSEYKIDGINVLRLPVKKYIPHGKFSIRILDRQVTLIKNYLSNKGFTPDIILGHWVNPQIYLEYKLKKIYDCKTSLVLHESGTIINKYKNSKDIIDSIDVWGYRSDKIRRQFLSHFGKNPKFRCFSGIDNKFFENVKERTWEISNRYIYVGTLIKRKFPDIVIEAIHAYYNNINNYSLVLYGDGVMRNQLKALIVDDANISLKGRKTRDELINAYDNSDIFVMISEGEVFGLVYLEAMARGCIVIASKGEGMEGIIEDGINGFFCKAGDKEDLIRVLKLIDNLSIEEKRRISQNAITTAYLYSDEKVAKDYINNVMNEVYKN